jgi:mercuric ion transport protein
MLDPVSAYGTQVVNIKTTETLSARAAAGIAKAGCAAFRAKRGGILWGTLAVITCPCHLPILAVVLSGTALGALLQEHFTLTVVLFSVLFLLSLWAVTGALSARAPSDP